MYFNVYIFTLYINFYIWYVRSGVFGPLLQIKQHVCLNISQMLICISESTWTYNHPPFSFPSHRIVPCFVLWTPSRSTDFEQWRGPTAELAPWALLPVALAREGASLFSWSGWLPQRRNLVFLAPPSPGFSGFFWIGYCTLLCHSEPCRTFLAFLLITCRTCFSWRQMINSSRHFICWWHADCVFWWNMCR